jgi:hypothetical protein
MGRSCWLLLVALAASAAARAQPSSPSPAPLASTPGETIPGTLAQITRLPEAVRERFTDRLRARVR